MHLVYPVVLAALLFSIGIYGVLARRNAVLILMSIEIMLNAVNINLIAFNAYLRDPLMGGQIFALFVITVAAAEVGVGLAIVLLIFRNRETVDLDSLRELSDAPPVRPSRAREEAPVR
ncbi:MAG TPA: NADH-quinone oxidoreductase subunit NuoK [Frankiaceae bacterium]|nr:NADH-quinone oxidoreductase subunit NuoK [Frankiaceae bacterium]